jgi:Insertion element 4 transposase N-terminal
LSPDGWLPDRVSMGALTRAFPPELVDQIIEVTDTREVRRRLLPARLVMYFVLALWLFRGRNCGYGQVMSKLVDALYHRRRGERLLEGLPLDPDGFVEAGGATSPMAKFSNSGPTGAVGSLARSSDSPMSLPPRPESVTINFGVEMARVVRLDDQAGIRLMTNTSSSRSK